MLTIRPAQMKVFEKIALASFEDEMVGHSQVFAPQACEALGEDQVRAAVHASMKRAGKYEFTNRGPLRLFIEAVFLLGSDFDTDPQYPWAREVLIGTEDQMKRAELLWDRLVDYQQQVLGPDAMNLRRAWAGLLELVRPAEFPVEHRPTKLVEAMIRIFPAKVAYIGEAVCHRLCRDGAAEARRHHFPRGAAESLLTMLMFVLGHGCATDAVFPWVQRALADETNGPTDTSAGPLRQQAAVWLASMLPGPTP